MSHRIIGLVLLAGACSMPPVTHADGEPQALGAPLTSVHVCPETLPPTETAALEQAMAAWSDALGMPVAIASAVDSCDIIITMSADCPTPGALGCAVGAIPDATIRLTGAAPHLLPDTIMHELGHVLGCAGHLDSGLMYSHTISGPPTIDHAALECVMSAQRLMPPPLP